MKNVLIVIPSLSVGGAERAGSQLSRFLRANITVLVYDRFPRPEYPHAGELVHAPVPRLRGPIGRLRIMHERVRTLRRIKRERRIDVSISFLENLNLANALSRAGERVVLSIRSQKSLDVQNAGPTGVFYRIATPLLYNRVHKVVACSRGVGDDLVRNFHVHADKVIVIPNGLDLARIRADAARPIEPAHEGVFRDSPPVVMTIGRLEPQKGHRHVVRAFAAARPNMPLRARLVFLGAGAMERELPELARALGLKVFAAWEGGATGAAPPDADIYFLGFVDNPYRYLARAGVFVLASLYEGMPNVVLEAMACGVAVISADCPSGPREILAVAPGEPATAAQPEQAQYGVLMPMLDGEAHAPADPLTREEQWWADWMTRMLADDGLRADYARRGLARSAEFDFTQTVRAWQALVDEGELSPGARTRR